MENTLIEWATHTFNPWEGCVQISEECDHCYAENRDRRFHAGSHWGRDALRLFHVDAYWKKPLQWDRDAQAAGERHEVFYGSLCDYGG
jgi:protein gp37